MNRRSFLSRLLASAVAAVALELPALCPAVPRVVEEASVVGKPILAVSDWGSHTVDHEYLDAIVQNFTQPVPVTLGWTQYDESGNWELRQIGWVTGLRLDGAVLRADMDIAPEYLSIATKKGHVSSEVFMGARQLCSVAAFPTRQDLRWE